MNRTPWFLTVCSALLTIVLALANYVSRTPRIPGWLKGFADFIAPDPLQWVFIFSVLGVVLPITERVFGARQFKKLKTQRVLDTLADDLLEHDPKQHRCTLFRAVRGLQALPILLWRMLWHQDEKFRALSDIGRIRPWGLYLYVYARPKNAKNPHSCAVYRVYRERARGCEGMAGMVWQQDEHTVRNLPQIKPGELRTMKELSDYPQGHPYRLYAELTNIRDARQMRARENYGRHFHGTKVEAQAGGGWGVLLIDSLEARCPFPESKRKNDAGYLWAESYDRYAELLSKILT